MNTSEAFKFDQRGTKHPLPAVALRSGIEQRGHAIEFIVVKHRHVRLASPAPKHLHNYMIALTGAPLQDVAISISAKSCRLSAGSSSETGRTEREGA